MPLLDLLEKLRDLIDSAIAQLKSKPNHKHGDIIMFSARKNASRYTLGYVVEAKEVLLVYTLGIGLKHRLVEIPAHKAIPDPPHSPQRYAQLISDIPEIYKRPKSR